MQTQGGASVCPKTQYKCLEQAGFCVFVAENSNTMCLENMLESKTTQSLSIV